MFETNCYIDDCAEGGGGCQETTIVYHEETTLPEALRMAVGKSIFKRKCSSSPSIPFVSRFSTASSSRFEVIAKFETSIL